MRVKDRVPKVMGVAVGLGRFLRRRKRLTIAVVVAALLVGPLLLTGDGEVFVLNAVGLGLGALLLRRFIRPGGRQRTGRAQQAQRQPKAKATQHEGGHDDDGNGNTEQSDIGRRKNPAQPGHRARRYRHLFSQQSPHRQIEVTF